MIKIDYAACNNIENANSEGDKLIRVQIKCMELMTNEANQFKQNNPSQNANR
jgi:hypothetical protein